MNRINVDALKLCYKPNEALFNYLLNHPTDNIERDGYTLLINSIDEDKNYISAIILDGGEKLADIVVNSPNYRKGYIYLTMANKALYTPISHNCNKIPYLQYIADDLGLILNNITKLEIAVDSEKPIIKRLERYLYNPSKYQLIQNNKIKTHGLDWFVDNAFKVDSIFRNRKIKCKQESSYYFHNAKKTIQLKFYNKKSEILMESQKHYIFNWFYGEIPQTEHDLLKAPQIYRAEITLTNEPLKEYIQANRIEPYLLYYYLTEQKFLVGLWYHFTNSILRFRKRGERDTIKILDLIA